MKIVYLYPSLAIWGGVERILVDKMNYMVRRYGYEVYMITSDQGGHAIPYPLDEQVRFIDLDIRFHQVFRNKGIKRFYRKRQLSKLYHDKLKRLLKGIQPDLLVCTTFQNVKSLIRIKGNVPLLVESHLNFNHPETFVHRMQTYWNNYWIGTAEAVVTLTNGDAKNWIKVSRNVHVIPNMVSLNQEERYSDCTAKRILFVGRFSAQKGIDELFSIWQQVHQRFPDWRLDLYGEGDGRVYYQQMAAQLDANIFVHEPTRHILDVYRQSSVLVSTSVYEPFGLVIPEAMSCGLPVVAFDCPYGPATILTEREDGFLIPNRNQQQFIDCLCQLMESVNLRQQMGMKAIISSQRFSEEQIMPMWKRLFEHLTSLS